MTYRTLSVSLEFVIRLVESPSMFREHSVTWAFFLLIHLKNGGGASFKE